MALYFDWIAFASIGLPWILHVSKGFLLLCIYRDSRLSASLPYLDATSNEFKLGISIWMLPTLYGLSIGLETVSLGPQQTSYCRAAD